MIIEITLGFQEWELDVNVSIDDQSFDHDLGTEAVYSYDWSQVNSMSNMRFSINYDSLNNINKIKINEEINNVLEAMGTTQIIERLKEF